ncbi:hypothetical protein SEA_SCHOMBER_66 [Gordonia Phage Schomber]|nr:hypothetical protein SEA_SCHOMBER_66 [Gordonia Phage Schomber]
MRGAGVNPSDIIVNVLSPRGSDETDDIPCRIYLRYHDGFVEVQLRKLSMTLEDLIDGTMASSAFTKNQPKEMLKEAKEAAGD